MNRYAYFFSIVKQRGLEPEDWRAMMLELFKKESLKDLTDCELKEFVLAVNFGQDSRKKDANPKEASIKRMRSRVLYIAQNTMGYKKEGTVDWDKFNRFMLEKSVCKKPLKDYSYHELVKLVSQFEQIAQKTKISNRKKMKKI